MSFGQPGARGREWTLDDEGAEPIFRQALDLGDVVKAGTSRYLGASSMWAWQFATVQQVAEDRGVSMAQVAMAWVLRNPVVTAPIVGPTKPHHLADAVAALDLELTDDEVTSLEEHYTPRTPTWFA